MAAAQQLDAIHRADLVDATRIVTEHRIGRFPIPTNTSRLYDDPDGELRETLPHFTAITSTISERALLIGVNYEWMYRGDIEPQTLLAADRRFRDMGFRFVLIPFVAGMELLEQSFDACTTIRCVQLTPPKHGTQLSSDYFFYDRAWAKNMRMINDSNFLSAQIYEQLKKLSHIMLSDEAAPLYDASYGKGTFGTRTYMELEDAVLRSQIDRCVKTERAIELGCGTGRHTFSLAERFRYVDGYDFSGKMIEVAERRRAELNERRDRPLALNQRHLRFHIRDIEMFPPQHNDIDLVAGLFGMGSFVEDLDALLAYSHSALAPQGRIVLSFYNRTAAVYTEPPPWRFSALSAELVGDTDELQVKLSPEIAFRIFCRAWSPDEIARKMRVYFEEVEAITIPKASAVFPRDYPMPDSALAADLLRLEEMALFDKSFALGPYILASGMKSGGGLREIFYDTSADTGVALKDLTRSGRLKHVHGFWDSQRRPRNARNVQPIIGFATADAPTLRDVPIAIIRPWDVKLERHEINSLLRPLFGRSRVFAFAEKDEVQQTFGHGSGAVPSGVFKPNVIVALHPALREGGPFRMTIGDRVFEASSWDALSLALGGRIIPSPAE